jgi:hypothetical protein
MGIAHTQLILLGEKLMGASGPKNYRIDDLYNGMAHENGNSLFWIGRIVAIGAVLEKDFVKALAEDTIAPSSSVVGILTGITLVRDIKNPEMHFYFRLSIGNEIVIAPPESSSLALFPRTP